MQFTLRNLGPELSRRLKNLSQSRGESLNTTILRILEQAVEVNRRIQHLDRYATWTEEDLEAFNAALSEQRQIDGELWK